MSDFFKCMSMSICGLCLLALAIGGCGTLTGATLGGAAGAGIGAGTHSNVGRSAAIGAGVGGTAGALYDIFGCCRSSNRRGYDD
jgi:outer membrane lipoprotein SlyB